MQRKDRMDGAGAALLIGFSVLMGFNQVVIKVTNGGLQPVFAAGLRSALSALCILLLVWLGGRAARLERRHLPAGLLIGALFATEFTMLFTALDLTTVTRVSVIFYTMPVWLALAGHFVLPGEGVTGGRLLGLGLASAGIVLAFSGRSSDGAEASLLGDLLALLACWCWAAIALVARLSSLRDVSPLGQLNWQVVVSAGLLLAVAPLFGPLLRDPQPIHWAGLALQGIGVSFAGFLMWFWLLTIYPAGAVASFGFLAPVFGVGLGWALLGEQVGPQLLAALVLVAAGLWLINRPRAPRADQVPQKV